MDELFEQVLNASLYGGILIVVVSLLRLLLKSAPRKLTCLLWLLVGLRLLMPFEIESKLSLQPKMEQIDTGVWMQSEKTIPEAHGEILDSQGEVTATRPLKNGRGEILNSQGEILVTKPLKPAATEKKVTLGSLLPWFWIAGVAAMGIHSLIAYLQLKRRVRERIVLDEGIWFCPGLDTAFVLGLFRPQIYLPGLGESEVAFVVAHEKAHIARKDHWWKFLGYVVLAIHWFNPLVWLGYVLLCRDLEIACDEAVIQSLELADRKAYSHALLSCSTRHSLIGACPVAFGEVSVGERIKNVLKYKKPKIWVCMIAVLAVIVAAVCFLTVPSTKDEEIAARLGGNVFTWEKKELDIFSFEIELDEDGRFYFTEGIDPYYAGYGEWSVKDGILKFRDEGMDEYRNIYFRVDGNDLIYLADKSARFHYNNVVDGDRFYMIQDIGNAEEKLTQCRDAFEKWASAENYHVHQYNTYAGSILDESADVDYWKLGDDWLYTMSIPNTDNGRMIYRLRKDGVEYQQELYETQTDNPQGWFWSVAEDSSDCMDLNWYKAFNWEKANIQYVRTDIINRNKERVTLTVLEDPSAFGKYCPYTVRFLFDSDGFPLYAYMTLEENKGERDWRRTDSAYILCNCEESEAKIEEAYADYLEGPVQEDEREATNWIQYAYGYMNMSIPLPYGWEYEIEEWSEKQENGMVLQTCGIRFRPEGKVGWISLRFRSNIFGAFSTEDMEQHLGLPVEWTNYEVTQGVAENSNRWRYIRYNYYRDGRTYIPGTYIAWNDGADGWLQVPENEVIVMEILDNVRLAEGILRTDEALEIASNAVELPENYGYGMEHDYLTGIYKVVFSTNEDGILYEFQIDNNGKILSVS